MRVKEWIRSTLKEHSTRTGITGPHPHLDGYEITLDDGSIHWCSEELFTKLIEPEYAKSKNFPPITLA